jgi:peroxin-19
MGMMEQLTNKEILYEPMKELDEKFPEWLIKNRDATPKDDLKRYEEQQSIVRQIVAKFEEKTYSDSNATDREFIVDKMQKVCSSRDFSMVLLILTSRPDASSGLATL